MDLFATNCPQNIVSVNNVSVSLSDHETVVAARKINSCKLPQRTVQCNWDSVFETDDVNHAWLNCKAIFSNVCDEHAPRRKKPLVRGKRCPWLTPEIKDLMNKRDFHLRKARKTNAEVDWSASRQARNYVSNKISRKRRFHRKELDNNLGNPTAFWKTMKRVCPNKKEN